MMNTQPGASAPTEDTKPSNHPGLTENTETTPIDSERQKKSKNRLSFHPARRMFGSGSVHDLFKETDDVLLAHRMRVEAKKRSITYQVIGVIAFTFVFLTFSTILFVRVADLNVRDALLYVVYTTTSTGFGTVPMPKDEPLFFFYLSFFMYVGLFCTMSLASHIFLFVSMRASITKERAKLSVSSSDGAMPPPQQPSHFSTPLEALVRSIKKIHNSSELGKFATEAGFLLFLLFIVPLPMMYFEDWSYPRSLYFWTFVMSTVGYGDIVPTTAEGIWYTIFWLPWNVVFVCIYTGCFARYYLMAGNWYTEKVYERAWKKVRKNKVTTEGDYDSLREISARAVLSIVQERFSKPISLHEGLNETDQDGDENEDEPVPEPIRVLQSEDRSTLSLASFSLASSRLALLIGHHMAGISFDFTLRGNDAYLKMPQLHECMSEWFIPSGARPFVSLLAYEILLLVGQRKLSIDGPRTILRFPAEKLYEIVAPVIAAFGDTDTIHAWMAWTVTLETKTDYDMVLWQVVLDRSMELSEIERTEIAELSDLETLSTRFADVTAKVEQNATWYEAKSTSVRRITLLVLFVLVAYELPIMVVVIIIADSTLAEGLLFTGYTLTSAGFGSVEIPKDDGFLLFAVVNLFISITVLTAVVAQVHSYLFLRGVMAKQHNDAVDLAKKGIDFLKLERERVETNSSRKNYLSELNSILFSSRYNKTSSAVSPLIFIFSYFDETDVKRNLGAVLLMLAILLVGICATMATEGWSFLQALYFCSSAVLTVGHGDLVPSSNAGTWVAAFYTPVNTVFLSLFFLLVARFFSFVHKASTMRIEKKMKEEMKKARSVSNSVLYENKDVPQTETNHDPTNAPIEKERSRHNPPDGEKVQRRGRIKQISMNKMSFNGKQLSTAGELFQMIEGMTDVINAKLHEISDESKESLDSLFVALQQVLPTEFHDLLSEWPMNLLFVKRLFALEALCLIIGSELRNYTSGVETHTDTVLRFTIEGLENWGLKWSIPLFVWHVFKEVVFESLFYVGEDRVQSKGYAALLELSIAEVIELFSPFVLCFSDVEDLDSWLHQIQEPLELAKNSTQELPRHEATRHKRPIIDTEILKFFPTNAGNAIRSQLVANMQ